MAGRLRVIVVGVLVVGCAALSWVAEGASPQAAADAKTQAAAAQEARAEAQQALAEIFGRYRGLPSYRDVLRHRTVEIRMTHEPGDTTSRTREWTLAYEAPGKLRVECDKTLIVSDGETLSIRKSGPGQFLQRPLAAGRNLAEVIRHSDIGLLPHHPLAVILLDPEATLSDALGDHVELLSVETVEDDPQVGLRIHAELPANLSPAAPITITTNADDGLIREIRVERTNRRNRAGTRFERLWYRVHDEVLQFERVAETEAAPNFTFEARGAERVKLFHNRGYTQKAAEQLALLNHPAPPLRGESLQGEPVSLRDYRGKTVLLDFWGTWCGGCVAGLPVLQRISQDYDDQEVVVLGVAWREETSAEDLTSFLADRDIRFPQMRSADRDAEAYRMAAAPTLMLVDSEGVIRQIHIGYREEEVRAELDRFLAGEVLVSAEALAKRQQQAAADANGAVGTEMQGNPYLPEVNPQCLTELDPFLGEFQVLWDDVVYFEDGEIGLMNRGEPSMLLTEDDGARVRRLLFRGDDLPEYFRTCHPVEIEGETCWLGLGVHISDGRDSNSSPAKASLYGPEGEQRWVFDASLDETTISRSSAPHLIDVDGDGEEEILLASSLERYTYADGEWRADRTYRQGAINVLELDGSVLLSQQNQRWGAVLGVLPAKRERNPPTILCSGGRDGLRAFVFSPIGGGENGEEAMLIEHEIPASRRPLASLLPGADLDGRGERDVVRYDYRGLALEYAEDGEVLGIEFQIAEHFDLRGNQLAMQWRDVSRFQAGGKTYWALVIARYDNGPKDPRLFVCDDEGELLWVTAGGVGEDTWRQLSVEVADLNGDGDDEILLATEAAYWRKGVGSDRMFQAQESSQAYLSLFSVEGELLSRQRIGDKVTFLHVMEPDADGVRRILCVRENACRRFVVDGEELGRVPQGD